MVSSASARNSPSSKADIAVMEAQDKNNNVSPSMHHPEQQQQQQQQRPVGGGGGGVESNKVAPMEQKKQDRLRRYMNNRMYIVIGLAIVLVVPTVKDQKDYFSNTSLLFGKIEFIQQQSAKSLSNTATLSAVSVVASNHTINSMERSVVSQKAPAQNTAFQNHTMTMTSDKTVINTTISKPAAAAAPAVANNKATTTTTATTQIPEIVSFDDGFYIQTFFPQTFSIERIVQVVKGGTATSISGLVPPPGIRHVQAVCVFQPSFAHSAHFPHTMQQIYACWSWWQHVARLAASVQSKSSVVPPAAAAVVEVQPILVVKMDDISNSKHSKNPDAPFVPGLLSALERSIFNLTLVENMSSLSTNSSTSTWTLVAHPKTNGGYKVSSRLDAPSLRTAVLSVLTKQKADNPQIAIQATSALETKSCKSHDANGGGSSSSGFPRILILNRLKSRRIINVDKMQHAIMGLLHGNGNNTNPNATTSVRVERFEDRSFAEQAVIMANADIVISPHGAQLTSLPFMKSQPCGAVLELFPMGYWVPHYFGSLAAASGVNQHFGIYLGDAANRDREAKMISSTVQGRVESRKRNLEVPLNRTLVVVEKMIQAWRQCCDAHVVAGSESST